MLDKTATTCRVPTGFGTFDSNCQVDDESRLITVTGIFSSNAGYLGPITIELDNVKNPATNRIGNGFVIQTYYDANQDYIQDKLDDFIL